MKGQYFSFDAIIASVIFVLALVALLSYWHSVRSFLNFQNDQVSMDAIRVSNSMFDPPSPSSDCSSIIQMGFGMAWDDRRVNESFLRDCVAKYKTEADLRTEFGTPYNITINVTNLGDGSVLAIDGQGATMSGTNIVKIRRLATIVNDTGGTYLAAFDITLYQ